jgi:hypothetical protein
MLEAVPAAAAKGAPALRNSKARSAEKLKRRCASKAIQNNELPFVPLSGVRHDDRTVSVV